MLKWRCIMTDISSERDCTETRRIPPLLFQLCHCWLLGFRNREWMPKQATLSSMYSRRSDSRDSCTPSCNTPKPIAGDSFERRARNKSASSSGRSFRPLTQNSPNGVHDKQLRHRRPVVMQPGVIVLRHRRLRVQRVRAVLPAEQPPAQRVTYQARQVPKNERRLQQ